jgi:hypothetical protein
MRLAAAIADELVLAEQLADFLDRLHQASPAALLARVGGLLALTSAPGYPGTPRRGRNLVSLITGGDMR